VNFIFNTKLYSLFYKFVQVKLGYGGFWLEPISTTFPGASKTMLALKVVESDSKIIITLCLI